MSEERRKIRDQRRLQQLKARTRQRRILEHQLRPSPITIGVSHATRQMIHEHRSKR